MQFRLYYKNKWLKEFNYFVKTNGDKKLGEVRISDSLKRMLNNMINRAIREVKKDHKNFKS